LSTRSTTDSVTNLQRLSQNCIFPPSLVI